MTELTSTKHATILIVDDEPTNLNLLSNLLKEHYLVKIANSGLTAIKLATEFPPDLILLDIMMPEIDGYEVCARLKASEITRQIPVIFITAKTQDEDERYGLELGAVDFIHKPINPSILLARVRAHLEIRAWHNYLRDKNSWLEDQVEMRLSQVNKMQDGVMLLMVSLAESRDETTGNHIRRTQEYVRALALEMAKLPKYSQMLTDSYIEMISKSAPLHDIGKISIPDHILLKPGKLTPEEFEIMKTHAQLGHDILQRAGESMGGDGEFLRIAMEIAGSHHEKWDGSGYPKGLVGEQIPLPARLMAVADVFDALISKRPYKSPMGREQTISILVEGRGSHFDPEVIDAFLAIQEDFWRIATVWADIQ